MSAGANSSPQISLDEIHANRTAGVYVLARRDNAAARTGITPIFELAYHGLRAYLVELAPGESGSPRTLHQDAEAILVTSGLVTVDLGDEMPVLLARRCGPGHSDTGARVDESAHHDLAPVLDPPGAGPRRGANAR